MIFQRLTSVKPSSAAAAAPGDGAVGADAGIAAAKADVTSAGGGVAAGMASTVAGLALARTGIMKAPADGGVAAPSTSPAPAPLAAGAQC